MPYKSFYTDPGFGQGIQNLSSALFPDPRRQQADQLNQMRSLELEQKINVGRRDAMAQDDLFNAIMAWDGQNANPTQAMALQAAYGSGGASSLPNVAKGFGAQQFLTGQGGDDARRFDLMAGMGQSMNQNSAVSLGHQDQISARNADEAYRQAMDVERLKQAGQDRRSGPPGHAEATATQINQQWRIQQRMRANPSLSYADAQAAEFGDVSVGPNAVTGLEARRRRDTGEIVPMQYPSDFVNELPEWARGQSQFEGVEMQPATGIKGNIRQGINAALGGVGLPEAWPEVSNYFTSVRRLRDESAINYAADVNSRPAMALVEMFRQLSVDPDKWMQGDEAVYRQLRELNNRTNRTLSQREAQYRERAHMMKWDEQAELVSELQTLNNMRADTEFLMDLFGNMSGGRQQAGAGPGPGVAEEPVIAVNPQTGERLQLLNGQWVPMQ